MNKTIHIIGSISKDILFLTNKIPNVNEESFGTIETYYGGSAANSAAYFPALFNIAPYLLTCIGDDELGEELLNNLKELKIQTNYVKKITNERSTQHIITIDEKHNRSTHVSYGAMGKFSLNKFNEDQLNQIENLLISPISPTLVTDTFLKFLEETQARLFFNPSTSLYSNVSLYNQISNHCYCIIGNVDEVLRYTRKSSIRLAANELLKRGVTVVSITLGERGSVTYTKGQKYVSNGLVTNVKQTIGCGDAYTAAFCGAIILNWNLQKASDFSNITGGYMASQEGVRENIPLPIDLTNLNYNPS